MSENHPALPTTQEAKFDGQILQSFAPPAHLCRWSVLVGIRQEIEELVLIVSPELAGEALSWRQTENASPPKFIVDQ